MLVGPYVVPALVDAEHRILSDVLGLMQVSRHRIHEADQSRIGGLVEILERREVVGSERVLGPRLHVHM